MIPNLWTPEDIRRDLPFPSLGVALGLCSLPKALQVGPSPRKHSGESNSHPLGLQPDAQLTELPNSVWLVLSLGAVPFSGLCLAGILKYRATYLVIASTWGPCFIVADQAVVLNIKWCVIINVLAFNFGMSRFMLISLCCCTIAPVNPGQNSL